MCGVLQIDVINLQDIVTLSLEEMTPQNVTESAGLRCLSFSLISFRSWTNCPPSYLL